MNKFRINRIYTAFALFCCAGLYTVVNSNPYQNIVILGLAFVVWSLLVAFAFDNPTESEKKAINKISDLI